MNQKANKAGKLHETTEALELAVETLRAGDRVDLRSCPFLNAHATVDSEYAVVESIERETPDCVAVTYEDLDMIGYQVGTKLKVSPETFASRELAQRSDDTNLRCSFCEEQAVAEVPQSSDLGKTVRMVRCCSGHRSGWWDGADWDGRHLEVDLLAAGKMPEATLGDGANITSYCQQVCGGGECGTGPECKYGVDPLTEMPASGSRLGVAQEGLERSVAEQAGQVLETMKIPEMQSVSRLMLMASGRFITDEQGRKVAEMYQPGDSPAEREAIKNRIVGSFNALPSLVGVLLRADNEGALWQALYNEGITDAYAAALSEAVKALGDEGVATVAHLYELDARAIRAKIDVA